MAKRAQIQVRIDEDEKAKARELFERYGLTTSAAVNLFIRRSLKENRLPFNLDDQGIKKGSGIR